MSVLEARKSRSRTGGPSFTFANRLARVTWGLVWLVLARFTPPQLHRWRAMLVRLFGGKLGRNVRIHGSAIIWLPANLELGDNVLIGPGARLYNQGHVAIGRDSIVSQRAHLCASSHDLHDPDFQLVLRPIRLGAGCWVAAEAFVGPGVSMSDGSVLGARGVLFDDTEAHGVYLGNPAQIVKSRRR